MTQLSLVLSTIPSDFDSKSIIETLISENLAACISSIPNVSSNYIWEGKLQESNESLLLIKTKTSLINKLENRLAKLHPYDTPEIISIKAETVNQAYLEWILNACCDK